MSLVAYRDHVHSLWVPLDLCLTTMATSLLNPDLLRPKLKLDVGIWQKQKAGN